ncbi:MAG: aminotransferase class V-fold PLP-dependent enzyme, partial [Gemmatimonadota bacterium]|nr:aminotransferase class V-fold PLP-dependent enzyme [Gemmatimonadota bacterium]
MTFTADRPSSTAEAFEEFKKKFPSYDDTSKLDELRSSEYDRLDELGHVYVDYTGAGMYAASQVKSHADFLLSSALGNPHSSNPTSMEANERVEKCRKRVLEFFNADPDEYLMVYTANASHGLKLIGESYPFESGGKFALTFDNHNSVNGIREFARSHGAAIEYVPVLPPDLRLAEDRLLETLQSADPDQDNLFAFPAQSNFSGVKHPLAWIEKAQQLGWDVMLDAAAFAPTNRLDLSLWHPEFVVLSFYK